MENDLISRSRLRMNFIQAVEDENPELYGEIFLDLIDNAPTVKFSLLPTDESKEEAYMRGYKSGMFKGFLKANARPQGEWISVNERLPEDMQKVLIWFEYYRYGDFNCMYQTYGFGYVCDDKWSPFINGETGWQDYRVIAWQPLPEPYKKGDTE